ncbi:MAG: transporter-like protein [Clostridiales bacterium]|nr:transporter-like protein [Clostridiales bacterium]
MEIIKIKDLTKKYGSNIAVDNINLSIDQGEIFGLIGPNGAGKSTTINSLCGLLRASDGEIIIDGINMREDSLEAKKRLGLVPQEIAIFENLTGRENIEFFGKLAGLRGSLLKERVDEALEFVGLSDKAKSMPKGYSGGMKRRLNIACAIAHHPKIIILDEPTVGIDPQSRNHILESVKKLNKMGSTIIYTTHYMEEAEALCSRIAIMDHGRLIADGTKEELKKLVHEEEKIIINGSDISFNTLEEIKAISQVKDAQLIENSLEIITSSTQLILQDILFLLSKNGVRIKGIQVSEPDLETVFLSLTGRKLRD